jgi:hypothetical protein
MKPHHALFSSISVKNEGLTLLLFQGLARDIQQRQYPDLGNPGQAAASR